MSSDFNGIFTQKHREAFRQKRETLHLTRYGLAKILGVEQVTIKRWEEGPSEKCNSFLRNIVADYLCGKLDTRIILYTKTANMLDNTGTITSVLEKIIRLYRLSSKNTQTQKEMLRTLDNVTNDTIASLNKL